MGERRFTWLHLTDLHVGQAIASPAWNNALEAEVIGDLQNVIAMSGPIDAVFFTGDLVQSGQETQYQEFDAILHRLVAALPQDEDPVFLAVPGNHDLVRPPKESSDIKELGSWTEDPGVRDRYWSDSSSDLRGATERAFANWTSWADQGLGWDQVSELRRDGVLPGDFIGTITQDSLRIGVLGLNTAALQLADGDFEGRLSLDGSQAAALVDRMSEWILDHDACFLLTHHDPTWLDAQGLEALNSQIANPGRFVAHLCGHRHEQERTLVSVAGGAPKRTIIGRSLFGLEWYGEDLERTHGYSVGGLSFDDDGHSTFRMWPRWAVQQQMHGPYTLAPDQTDCPPDKSVTNPEDAGVSPLIHPPAADKPSGSEDAAPPGWLRIDREFLEERRSAVMPEDLVAYFDGEDPAWSDIASGRIPVLSSATRLLEDVTASRGLRYSIHLTLGPGGEGKTTAIMQAAAALASAEGWRVLWRHMTPDGALGRLRWAELRDQVDDDESLCLVIDDAHEVRGDIEDFLDREHLERALKDGVGVHLVLCAHSDDWNRSEPRRSERWRRRSDHISRLDVRGLETGDARLIVDAYRETEALGILDAGATDDTLAATLVQMAHDRSSVAGEAALLGALLQSRTGDSLEIHVDRILDGVKASETDTKLPAFRAFVAVAAASAVGVHRLNLSVLEQALGHDSAELLDAVTLVQTELRLDGLGPNSSIRARHGSIARAAARVAFAASPASARYANKQTVYRELGRGAASIPQFFTSPWSKPILDLQDSVRRSDQVVAVAVAQGAVDGAPEDCHVRSKAAQTYREVPNGDPFAAEATAAEFFRDYPDRLKSQGVRALVEEWAISTGESRGLSCRGARSTWLALWAQSDQVTDQLKVGMVRFLPTVTRAVALDDRWTDESLRQRVGAVVFDAGRRIPGMPYRDSAKKLAGSLTPSAAGDLATCLSEAAEAAWGATDPAFRAHPIFPVAGELTFNALVRIVEA